MTVHLVRVRPDHGGHTVHCACGWGTWTRDAQDAELEAALHCDHVAPYRAAERDQDAGGVFWRPEAEQ